MVSDLLLHLDIHKFVRIPGVHLRILRELAEVLVKPLSIIYQQSWLTREVSVDCRLANVMPIYQKVWKGRSRELQACQSDLSASKSHGADNFDYHFAANVGQAGDQAQLKDISCLRSLFFYDKVTCLAFDTLPHHPPEETVSTWLKCVDTLLGKKLTGWLGPKSSDESS